MLLISFVGVSCSEKQNHEGKTPLVEVNGNFLYLEDLKNALPYPISADDSTLFAEHYIRTWIDNVLLSEKANSNVGSNKEINQLVENYRRSLIMHSYQQELINQKLSNKLSEAELMAFYENNKKLFTLDFPLIKGLFIKVPITAPQINDVRKWYKSNTPDALDKLEKYRFNNAVNYAYFYDDWIPASQIVDFMPIPVDSIEAYINKTKNIEIKDSAFYYFLNISDLRSKGEEEPFEFARPDVVDMLINTKQVEFLKGVKSDLYQKALKQNKIKYKY